MARHPAESVCCEPGRGRLGIDRHGLDSPFPGARIIRTTQSRRHGFAINIFYQPLVTTTYPNHKCQFRGSDVIFPSAPLLQPYRCPAGPCADDFTFQTHTIAGNYLIFELALSIPQKRPGTILASSLKIATLRPAPTPHSQHARRITGS